MASVVKRGNSYRITVSNGRDAQGKQILEAATFTPDPKRTEKQSQKAVQEFANVNQMLTKLKKRLITRRFSFAANP